MEKITIITKSGERKEITFKELMTMINRRENFSVISDVKETKKNKATLPRKGYFTEAKQEKIKRLYLPLNDYETNFSELIKKIAGKNGFKEANKLEKLIISGKFLPHHNILSTLTPFSHIFNSIEDNFENIFKNLKDLATNFQKNISSTLDFSRIRPKMSPVKSTQGLSSGPVSFIKIFTSTLDILKQNQTSDKIPEQNFQLNIHHPDILEYLIFIKNFQKNSLNNNSLFHINITPTFLEALEKDSDFELQNPVDGETVNLLSAKNTFDLIISTIIENPRIKLNRSEPSYINKIEISAIINLAAYKYKELKENLANDIKIIEKYLSFQQQYEKRKHNSPIITKINFTGFGELLIEAEISYDSIAAIDLAEKILLLAKKSLTKNTIIGTDLNSPLSEIMSNSNGFEALENLANAKTNLDGQEILKLHPKLKNKLQKYELVNIDLIKNIFENKSILHINEIPPIIKSLFHTGKEIDHNFHLEFQRKIEQTTNINLEKKIYFKNPLDQEKIKNALLKYLIESRNCLGFFEFGKEFNIENIKPKTSEHNFIGTIKRKNRHFEIQPPLFQIKKTEEIQPPPIST